jgi:[acyl-carrier-protein] S-malonyltransferase
MSEKTAFVFPGQGSQKVGMLAAAHTRYEAVRETFNEASQALGYDMWDLIQNGEQEALNMTETTQPVLLTSSVALWRAWAGEQGAAPVVMAGHSLGEFSALVCAGSLGFADTVQLVRKRGAFMQSAVPVGQGAMAAIIGLDDDAINTICGEVAAGGAGVVAAVNFNSPGQVVMPLPVSAPFHTDLMKPAGEQLAEAIADVPIQPPSVPVVHNVHAATEPDPERIRSLLVEQIYSPVQWTRCVQVITDMGATQVVECGPGKVLSGLNRRIDKALQSYSLEEPDGLESAREALS